MQTILETATNYFGSLKIPRIRILLTKFTHHPQKVPSQKEVKEKFPNFPRLRERFREIRKKSLDLDQPTAKQTENETRVFVAPLG